MPKTTLLLLACFLIAGAAIAQNGAIPMTEAYWEADPATAEFITHEGIPAARLLGGGAPLYMRDADFKDGTITFDVALDDPGFVGIHFRQSANRSESEYVYLRAFWPVPPRSRWTVQYTTVIDSVSIWNLTDEYQAAAALRRGEWNQVKLVISGYQMRVYVNDMARPALHVPLFEGDVRSGGIALVGKATFANMVVRPGVTEGVPATTGFDPTSNDSHYLRSWEVTPPQDFPFGRDLVVDVPLRAGSTVELEPDLPGDEATWSPLPAGPRALVNLSRLYGAPHPDHRRLAWVRTTLNSEVAQTRRLDLGFGDEVWVFVNGQFLGAETNYYGTPGMKSPRGRATLENSSFDLPLAEGENELLIAVANHFFGWGLIARLDEMTGILAE